MGSHSYREDWRTGMDRCCPARTSLSAGTYSIGVFWGAQLRQLRQAQCFWEPLYDYVAVSVWPSMKYNNFPFEIFPCILFFVIFLLWNRFRSPSIHGFILSNGVIWHISLHIWNVFDSIINCYITECLLLLSMVWIILILCLCGYMLPLSLILTLWRFYLFSIFWLVLLLLLLSLMLIIPPVFASFDATILSTIFIY